MPPIEAIDGSCETSDGLALHYRAWLPPAARGVLLIVHGLAEHSGRYAHVGPRFAGAGYAAYALDHRGHGLSPGRRVHVAAFDEFLGDVDALRAVAEARHPGRPLVLVGHSHGGLVALRYVLTRPAGLAGAILSSPLLGVHPSTRASPGLIVLARALSVLWPSVLLPTNVDASLLSHDPEVVRAYQADPLVSHRVSPRWFTSAARAMRQAQEGAPHLTLPLLLMVSGADRIVDPEASLRFAAHAPSRNLELVHWQGLYHEMFNEPEGEAVFARMEAWLEARVSPARP
jgi:alpha-beta hydrolase superfamily lysophospholipase